MNRSASFLIIFSLLCSSCGESTPTKEVEKINEQLAPNLMYEWGELALEATARDTEKFRPRPTITSRYLALIFTSVFDAWSRYDSLAIPVYLANTDRRPQQERTEKNKEIAISFAAYRAMSEYYFTDTMLFREFMTEHGFDPENRSLDPRTPEGIGNLAATAVIEARKNDGSNQYGELSDDGITPYSDYTHYKPANDADNNTNIIRWQPKYFADGKGGKWAPGCLTPFWDLVEPMALDQMDIFRPGPPPAYGSEQLKMEVEDVVNKQASLTDEEKALVEFMRDGPKSVQQAGHWLRFAQDVSRRDKHTLDEDVKMYFLVEIAAMDAFIACWDTKMTYDYARPYALIHEYYKGKTIRGWGGENVGMKEIKGEEWRPYSPETFVCPPFPAYVSGHSTVSGACSEVLKMFTGSDVFGEEVTMVAGALTEPGYKGDTITIKLPTFTETAEMAGISRVLGGYHIQADNIEGLILGRRVAGECWNFYSLHVDGKSAWQH